MLSSRFMLSRVANTALYRCWWCDPLLNCMVIPEVESVGRHFRLLCYVRSRCDPLLHSIPDTPGQNPNSDQNVDWGEPGEGGGGLESI